MTSKEVKKNPFKSTENKKGGEQFLILHNDDIHSFDYVIDALIDVCKHDFVQATQCTIITHYKGSCDVRKGNFDNLKPLKDALTNLELKATIN
ncbi:MAG: ATP-dependent Clp protease adaptor ClpS [Prolixibacteraceae bacterium]|nr:ATP-dependent Clp protease adaptor ClpS [Prolixibacteraceae bacterium]MBN2775754.1 ATP-dependent Clp protease adaptor ClpS [Prolixibacteraceae bacterium]